MSQTTEVPEKPDELEEVNSRFHELGFTDGLPIVPPTTARVAAMVAGSRLKAEHSLGAVPPVWGEATVERVAANAAMAGCRPEYMPVVLAALRGCLEKKFNLHGVQCTTHLTTPLVVVHGPIAKRLGVNGANNCFGQGWIANATIGRALRLALVNIGGARPGDIDRATLGHPGKYTYCIAENEAESPWPAFHVESAGMRPEQSAVTVFAAEAPHNINNHEYEPHRLLDAIAGTIATPGANNFYVMGDYTIVFGIDHAKILPLPAGGARTSSPTCSKRRGSQSRSSDMAACTARTLSATCGRAGSTAAERPRPCPPSVSQRTSRSSSPGGRGPTRS